ncbi:MAG: Gfo/Idh/MocA family oxidoreductase [Rhodobacteraceae bacterium]|nr:Gfo/Idh/MocA family oxidoreductase [Paracoccaceae bacterium]
MKKVRIAVVGGGFMGALHARTIAEADVAELGAIVDLNEALGKATAESFGTRWFKTVDDALAANAAEAYVVALPDKLHEAVTVQLLEAGKSVLVEKPMAHTLEAAQAMARAERAGGGRLLVAHILRFDPRYVQAAEAVRAGMIGDPVHASSGRFSTRNIGERMNGGSSVLFYLGVHDVDALQWISGSNVQNVFSRRVSKLMPAAGVNSEDAIFTTVQMSNGLAGHLYAGWTLPLNTPTGIWARTEIYGTEGMIDLDVRDHGLRIHSKGHTSLPDGLHWPEVNGIIMGDLAEEIRHFATATRDDKDFVMSVDEALRAVAVNDAILRSVASGRPEDVTPWSI